MWAAEGLVTLSMYLSKLLGTYLGWLGSPTACATRAMFYFNLLLCHCPPSSLLPIIPAFIFFFYLHWFFSNTSPVHRTPFLFRSPTYCSLFIQVPPRDFLLPECPQEVSQQNMELKWKNSSHLLLQAPQYMLSILWGRFQVGVNQWNYIVLYIRRADSQVLFRLHAFKASSMLAS